MFWPCETRTSTCRNLATTSSGLYRFLAITVLLDVKDIPQVGPLQWGWITGALHSGCARLRPFAGRRTENVDPPLLCGQYPVRACVGADACFSWSAGGLGNRVWGALART